MTLDRRCLSSLNRRSTFFSITCPPFVKPDILFLRPKIKDLWGTEIIAVFDRQQSSRRLVRLVPISKRAIFNCWFSWQFDRHEHVPLVVGKNYGRIFLGEALVHNSVFRSNQWFRKCPRLGNLDSLSIYPRVTFRENEQASEGCCDESCRFDFHRRALLLYRKEIGLTRLPAVNADL